MRRLPLLLVPLALAAHAHDADVIFAQLSSGPTEEVVEETVTLTAATLGLLAPLDADGDGALSQAELDARARAVRAGVWEEAPLQSGGQPCALGATQAELKEGYVQLRAAFRCPPGPLRQDFRILRVLPANYRVVLGSQLDGEARGQRFAQGALTAIEVPRPPPPGAWDGEAFRGAFFAGLSRAASGVGLGALCALLFVAGAWRKGLVVSGLAIAGLLLGSLLGLEARAALPLLLILLTATAAGGPPVRLLAAGVGLSVGLLDGGGGWSVGLGLGVGSALVWALASPALLAVGVMLQRRPRLAPLARWLPVLLVGLWAGARLSS